MDYRQQLMATMQQTAKPRVKDVMVPVWGKMYVRLLTVADVDAQQAENREAEKPLEGETPEQTKARLDARKKLRFAKSAARVLCDPEGNDIFDPEDDEHVALLAKQPWKLLELVLDTADQIELAGEEKGEGKG